MDKIKWKTVTYTIVELKPVGGVVIQRDVLEKYKAEHPDEEVKTFAGFKCDQQDKTVSLRIGIADDSITAGTVAKIEPELLQSERDELVALKEKYGALKAAVADDSQDFNLAAKLTETQKICHELQNELAETVAWNSTLKGENDRLILRLAEIADDDGAKEAITNGEDSADLVEAKKAIVEDGGISLDEIDTPEGELDDGTLDCCSDGTVPEDNEND